jgi:hypothetical protein
MEGIIRDQKQFAARVLQHTPRNRFDPVIFISVARDTEVVTTSILRVRPARLRCGFAAFVVMREGRLIMRNGEQSFNARRFFIQLCKICLLHKLYLIAEAGVVTVFIDEGR